MAEAPPKNPEAKVFLENVMRMAGVANPTELAAKMGEAWTYPTPLRKVYKWAAGEQRPNGSSTMALLKVAGLLSEPQRAVGEGSSDESGRLLGELEVAVAAMIETQKTLLSDLDETRTRLKRLEAARPSASARKGKRASL